MLTAGDFIDAVQRLARVRRTSLTAPGEFPPGWAAWLAQMAARAGTVRGAPADALVDVMAERPLAEAPKRAVLLTRRQALVAMLRQDWRPTAPDERRWHWTAVAFTTVWHAFFGAMLLWLMYLQYLMPPPARQGDEVVQVELLGRGAKDEPGGGEQAPQAEPTPASVAESGASAPQSNASPSAAPTESTTPATSAAASTAVAPAPAPPQPLAVTEPVPNAPEAEFVLPPVNRVAREVSLPEVRVPPRDVAAVDVPEPLQARLPTSAAAERTVQTRALPTRDLSVREVPAPLARVALPPVKTPSLVSREVNRAPAEIARRDVPTPAVPAATGSAPPAAATPAAPSAATASTEVSSTRAATGTRAPATTGSGFGPRPQPAPGASPTRRVADDWGDAARNRPGGERGTPGLYNSDGSPRIGQPPGSAAGDGRPPGTLTQEIKELDRAGTWLKRKPNDYEATAFDRLWVPHETLLQEWVRKGIKQVSIPIPGTSKHITCVVSLLQLGGGCGISDPNLNDQPPVARPPPDIPFKPELQDDNGSVRKPPGA